MKFQSICDGPLQCLHDGNMILNQKKIEKRPSLTTTLLPASLHTVLPEIFSGDLFSLNFAIGVGPSKLSEQIFLPTRNFDLLEFITTCMRCAFLDALELLLCSSLSFLDKLLKMSFLPGAAAGT